MWNRRCLVNAAACLSTLLGFDARGGNDLVAAAQGRVEASTESIALGFTVTGRIAKLFVSEGSAVRARQLLAQLECGAEQAREKSAAASLEGLRQGYVRARRGARAEERAVADARLLAATAEEKDAQMDFERVSALAGQGSMASRRELDSAQRRVDIALAQSQIARHTRESVNAELLPEEHAKWNADIAVANAALIAARDAVQQCSLLAPIDGTILRRLKQSGEVVNGFSPEPVVMMADVRQTRIRVEVDERDVPRVRLQQRVAVSQEGSEQAGAEGVVTWLAPAMGRKSIRGTQPAEKADRDIREVVVTLDRAKPEWPIGMRVIARFR